MGLFTASAVLPQLVSAQETELIGLEKAQEIALSAAGGGVITKSKLDSKYGMLKYEMEIRTGDMKHKIDIDAANGAVIKHEQKMLQKRFNHTGAAVPAAQAQAAALDRTGGGEVVKCKLDYGKRGVEYDITIVRGNNKYEVDVDANTGRITKYEQKMITRARIAQDANMLTPDRAKEIAFMQTGGGVIIKCELDYKKKYATAVYDVEVVKDNVKYEYEINAVNGIIIEYEIDYNYNISS